MCASDLYIKTAKKVGLSSTERYRQGFCGRWVWGGRIWWLGGCGRCKKPMVFWDTKIAQLFLLHPFQALQRFPEIMSAAHRKIHHDNTLSGWTDIWSIQLPFGYKKQCTAQEHGGIVRVVIEEIALFKRKGKKGCFSSLPNSPECTQVL